MSLMIPSCSHPLIFPVALDTAVYGGGKGYSPLQPSPPRPYCSSSIACMKKTTIMLKHWRTEVSPFKSLKHMDAWLLRTVASIYMQTYVYLYFVTSFSRQIHVLVVSIRQCVYRVVQLSMLACRSSVLLFFEVFSRSPASCCSTFRPGPSLHQEMLSAST